MTKPFNDWRDCLCLDFSYLALMVCLLKEGITWAVFMLFSVFFLNERHKLNDL